MRKIGTLLLVFISMFFYANAQRSIDKVVAVVGDRIILKSDIEAQYVEYLRQGGEPDEAIRCTVLEQLLTQKLLVIQAGIDSVTVDESRVEDELNRRLRFFTSQFGTIDKLEEFLGKSVIQFKDEARNDVRELLVAQLMQSNITQNITVSPLEVRQFFEKIPEADLPFYNTEVEVGQIIRYPVYNDEQKAIARTRLDEIRTRVRNGESFSNMAILYSQDPESAKRGGELGFVNRGDLVPQFEAVAFKLKPGEVSQVVETEFGFHIIQSIERRGDQINVRHILIQPTFSPREMQNARTILDSARNEVISGRLTWAAAATKFSDDVTTRSNGGMFANSQDGTSLIPLNLLEQDVFSIIDTMQAGVYSQPLVYVNPQDGKRGFRIIYYKSRIAPHKASLEQDYPKIQAAALNEKRAKAVELWFEKRRQEQYIRVNEEFLNCDDIKLWITKVTP